MSQAAEASRKHLVVPTFIASEPAAKEGHKEGQRSKHPRFHGSHMYRRTRTSRTSLLPKRIQQKRCPCRRELDPKASLLTPVLNQPKRTKHGHVTGMPSPSDADPPKRTPTKGQDKKPPQHLPRETMRPHLEAANDPVAPHPTHTSLERHEESAMEAT